jgi:hypothetical protein
MATRSEESTFEEEMLRLMEENNRLLKAVDEKLHKILLNTSYF